jgi:hypothetical protein
MLQTWHVLPHRFENYCETENAPKAATRIFAKSVAKAVAEVHCNAISKAY